jgi:hypothetical protein
MPDWQMQAQTQGIGQLIAHRQLLRVPDHQRDYAWRADDEVEQFLDDVIRELRAEQDYFLGLIVLLSPREDNTWEILDGQQRLATTTMIYAAIREWLHASGLAEDAHTVQNDYIGVRTLGQARDRPRLTLNINDREAFQTLVVYREANEQMLQSRRAAAGRHSSQRRLIDAVLTCRHKIAQFAEGGGATRDQQAERLYALADYLRNRVRVVVMDVPSTDNAFMIFEALNDRGLALSVLDLVKNHLFERAGLRRAEVQANWTAMLSNLGDRPGDDFLKVYWTSRYGRIRRGELFAEWRRRFDPLSEDEIIGLSAELVLNADRFAALDVADDDVWAGYSSRARRSIRALAVLGNQQVRPILLAASNTSRSSRWNACSRISSR